MKSLGISWSDGQSMTSGGVVALSSRADADEGRKPVVLSRPVIEVGDR
jgi:hypothetical protein